MTKIQKEKIAKRQKDKNTKKFQKTKRKIEKN